MLLSLTWLEGRSFKTALAMTHYRSLSRNFSRNTCDEPWDNCNDFCNDFCCRNSWWDWVSHCKRSIWKTSFFMDIHKIFTLLYHSKISPEITLPGQCVNSAKKFTVGFCYEQALNEITYHCCKFLEFASKDGYSEELFQFTEATNQVSIKSLGSCE